MKTKTHCTALQATILALTLFAAPGFATIASAQETPTAAAPAPEEKKSVGERITELSASLETRRAELDELAKKVDANMDRAAAVMLDKEISDRRAKLRRDTANLVELVLEGADAGTEVATGRVAATTMLEADASEMRSSIDGRGKESVTLIDTMAKGTPEEATKARQTFTSRIPEDVRLIQYLNENIKQRARLGLDVSEDEKYFKKLLRLRADFTAGLLSGTKSQIDELAARPGIDADPQAQADLASLRKQRDVLAEAQRALVALMDEYGMETADLRRGIISATGKLSQDILNKDVASGLVESWMSEAADWFRSNGASLVFQFLIFLLILFAFSILARIARGAVRRLIDRSKLSVSSLAKEFFIKTTSRLVMLLGFIIAIAQLGVEVAPLLAGLGIAGFIVGFALQDTLSNFASGLMILVYRPFDVGDAVEAGGVVGKVDQMNLVSTMILTFDNQLMVVPNKQIWGGIIRNITHKDTRRVDMEFGIGYADDIPKAEAILTDIISKHELVLPDPEPVIKLHSLGESSVNFIVRPWSKTSDYWDLYWDVTRQVKERFDAEGVSIPFPQRDVHVYHETVDKSGAESA